jgi:polysaccharide deacetylase 2 family uncharacterized protein YibQ
VPEKTKKTAKKPEAPGKPSRYRRKKTPKSTSTKKRKNAFSVDALRAVLLAAVLIAVSVFVSAGIIVVKAAARRAEQGMLTTVQSPPEMTKQENPAAENPQPAEQQPAAEKPAVKPEPAKTAVPEKPAAAKPVSAAPVPVQQPAKPAPALSAPTRPAALPERPPTRKGSVVLVIDDAGNNLRELEPFLRFPGPLTIAVLPGLPHSAEAARRIRAAGKEVFLHQPLEALGGQNPGPGAIYSGMSADEIRAVLKRNVAEIGPIAGMNNHQGSKITMDQAAMETVLAFCRDQGLVFLDSRTTAETVVPAVARQMGIKIGERNTFIDNEQNRASMLHSIKTGLGRAEQQSTAVMIGHTWSPDLGPLLAELYSGLVEQGYSFSTASAHIAAAGK